MTSIYDVDFENMSFDVLQFIERLSVEADWAKLLVAHIYLDHILTEFLTDHLPNPSAYFDSGRRNYSEKLSLCLAHGLIDRQLSDALRTINTFRNKFAHQLVFEVSADQKKELFRSFTLDRPAEDVLLEGEFDNYLLTVVVMTELSRNASKKSADIRRKELALQEELVAYVAQNVKPKTEE